MISLWSFSKTNLIVAWTFCEEKNNLVCLLSIWQTSLHSTKGTDLENKRYDLGWQHGLELILYQADFDQQVDYYSLYTKWFFNGLLEK